MFRTDAAIDGPREALREAQQRAGVIKTNAGFLRAEAESAGLSAGVLLGKAGSDLREHRDRLDQLAATPGLADLSAEVGFDVEAGMRDLITACDRVLGWVATGLPQDAEGWLLVYRFEAGTLTPRILTPAELAGLITELAALEALIQ